MATVNKDFKIKSGLVVEGTNGTINGHNILTESTSGDQYILNLIGGETLVKSVESTQLEVDGSGKLSVKNNVFDAYGSASDALNDANSYTDGALESYTPTASLDATVDGYGYLKSDDITGKQDNLTAGSNIDITGTTISVTGLDTDDVAEGSNLYFTNQRALDATSSAYDAAGTASGLIQDGQTDSTHLWSSYKTSTEIGLAQAAAQDYADDAVANVVGAAPELLDTLQELATALQDNPDVIQNIQDVAAGKQDTLTPGNGIVIDENLIYVPTFLGSGVSITPTAVEIDRAVVDGWYDESGAASDAQAAAETFATNAINALDTDDIEEGASNLYFTNQRAIDAVGGTIGDAIDQLTTDDIEEGLANQYFTDSRAKTSAANLLTGATKTNIQITGDENGLTITAENGVADSTTDDLVEGSTNKYFSDSLALGAISGSNIQPESIDITWVRREEATWTGVATASTATVHSFGTNKGSVKYLVRVISGGNSHVTELLATTDSNNNVAVVEYGTIYTSLNPLATATVVWNGVTSQYDLNVTTANNNSEVLVAATMLAYND